MWFTFTYVKWVIRAPRESTRKLEVGVNDNEQRVRSTSPRAGAGARLVSVTYFTVSFMRDLRHLRLPYHQVYLLCFKSSATPLPLTCQHACSRRLEINPGHKKARMPASSFWPPEVKGDTTRGRSSYSTLQHWWIWQWQQFIIYKPIAAMTRCNKTDQIVVENSWFFIRRNSWIS